MPSFFQLQLRVIPVVALAFLSVEWAEAQSVSIDKAKDLRSQILKKKADNSAAGSQEDNRNEDDQITSDRTPLGVDVAVIVLIPHQDKATMLPGIGGEKIQIAPGVIAPTGMEEVLEPYIGKPMSMALLAELARDVVNAWRESDYPLVDVYYPEQNVTGGKVQLVVRESVLGKKIVEGAKHSREEYIFDQVRFTAGDRINRRVVEADLDWLNENPIRRVNLIYDRGEQDGTTDMLLQIDESSPLTAYTGFANTGVNLTGQEEWAFGVNWANPFATEQNIGYNFSTNLDWDKLQAHSVFYQGFLPWRHQIRAVGAYVLTDAVSETSPGTFIDIGGESVQTSVEYRVPLGRPVWNRKLRHYLTAAWDYKKIDTDLLFGGINVFANAVEVFQYRFEYEAFLTHKNGQSHARFGIVTSPGDVLANNNDTTFDMARPGSTADYTYAFVDVQRLIELPEGFALQLRGNAQFTNDRLTSTEQMLGGGYLSVRGFDENLIQGDSGFIGSIELISPSFSLLDQVEVDDRWNVLTFYDTALLDIASPRAGEVSPSLQSAGLGLTCRVGENTFARATYGWNVATHGVPGDVAAGKLHFGLTVKY